MKRALDGSASISLRDGAIKGINLAQKLRDAQNLLGRGQDENRALNATEKTDFSEFSATFAIKDGVAVNDDLDVKSPLLRVGGAGRADIGAGTLDYTARVSVVGTLKGQDGRDLTALRGVTVPVRLQGPFDKPTYGIDWSGVAEQALKSKAAEQLKEKVAPQIKAQRDKLKEGARDALKGLLKP
jgi:AsmA protein